MLWPFQTLICAGLDSLCLMWLEEPVWQGGVCTIVHSVLYMFRPLSYCKRLISCRLKTQALKAFPKPTYVVVSKWSFPLKLQIQHVLGNVGIDFLSERLPRQRWSRKRGKAENDTFNSTPWLPCSSLASCQRIKQTKPRSPISSESTVLQLQWPIGSFLVRQTNFQD